MSVAEDGLTKSKDPDAAVAGIDPPNAALVNMPVYLTGTDKACFDNLVNASASK